ncbi:MAG: PAS domain S-box protein [candidate division KSB1 bacterium]|nr:PAS domain S-box protein [candidate division KSB1 bacterium]
MRPSVHQGGASILLLVSDPYLAQQLRPELERRGMDVRVASGREEALTQLKSETFDLILWDPAVVDPRVWIAASAPRRGGSDTAVLILGESEGTDLAREPGRFAALDFVSPDIGVSALLIRIEKALRQARTLSELRARSASLELLSGLAHELSRCARAEEVLATGLSWLENAVPNAAIALFLHEDKDHGLRLWGERGLPPYLCRIANRFREQLPLPKSEFVSPASLEGGRFARHGRLFARLRREFACLRTEALRAGDTDLGVLAVAFRRWPRFPELSAQLLRTAAEQLGLALRSVSLSDALPPWKGLEPEPVGSFRSLLENPFEGICAVVNGRFTLVNQAFCQMVGYEKHELIGQPFTMVLPSEEAPRIIARYARRLQGKPEPNRYEVRLLAKSGEVFDAECVVSVVQLGGRRELQAFVRDIREHKRVVAKLDRRNRELASLLEVARAATRSLTFEETLSNALRSAMRVVQADMGKIYLLSPEGAELRLAASQGESEAWWNRDPIPVGSYFSGRAVSARRVIHVTDSRSPEALEQDPSLAEVVPHSFLVVPLIHAGKVLGALNLGRRHVGGFSREEERIVRAIASFLALGIANSEAHERVLREARWLEALPCQTARLAQATGLRQILQILLQGAAELCAAARGFLAVPERGGRNGFRPLLLWEQSKIAVVHSGEVWKPDAALYARLQTAKGWYTNSPTPSQGWPRFLDSDLLNCAVVPVLSAVRPVAVLVLVNARLGFDDTLMNALRALANHAAAELEKAELFQRLRRSEEQFRKVFDAVPDGILILSEEGKVLEVNLHVLDLLGCKPTHVVGRDFSSLLVGKPGPPRFPELAEEALSSPVAREVEIRRQNGDVLPVELRILPFPSLGQSLWLAVVRDLTEHKRYEQALRRQKEFFERIIDNAGVAIVGGRDDGELLICNRRVTELTGYAGSELQHGRWREVFWPEGRRAEEGAGPWEKWVTAADGRRVCLRFTETDLLDTDGSRVGSVAFGHDVTDLRTMQAQLVQTEKLVALGQLVAGIAHELNNPLTAILGYTQLLEASVEDEQTLSDLRAIERECHRCRRIVENLLHFAGARASAKAPLDLNQVIRSVLELMGATLRAGRVQVELRLDPQLPLVQGEESQLSQVVLNLVSNAFQAFPPEQHDRRIVLHTSQQYGEVVLRVEDNGPGIPESVVDKIWDPFFTTKGVGKGSGLGLSVCYGIVQEHGGQIRLLRTSAAGTVFEVRLPAGIERQARSNGSGAGLPEPRRALRRGGRKALIVGTDSIGMGVLLRILGDLGYEAKHVPDLASAAERWREEEFEVLFCEASLFADAARRTSRLAPGLFDGLGRKLVLVTSEQPSPEVQKFVRDLGCSVLVKPILPGNVAAVLAGLTPAVADSPEAIGTS